MKKQIGIKTKRLTKRKVRKAKRLSSKSKEEKQ